MMPQENEQHSFHIVAKMHLWEGILALEKTRRKTVHLMCILIEELRSVSPVEVNGHFGNLEIPGR